MNNFPVEKVKILQGLWWLTCHQSPHSSTNLKSVWRQRDAGKCQSLLTDDSQQLTTTY